MQKGDIVHIDYEIWIKGAKSELFDTNREEAARAGGKWTEQAKYAPSPVILGYDRNMKKLEESLLKSELNKEYEVEITPADGAGERDPKKVKMYLMREILKLPEFQKKEAKYPEVGMELAIEGKVGTIAGIYAGRVRMDFNNRLAGKTLSYKYKVLSKDETVEARVKSVIELDYGNSADFVIAKEGADSVTITLPDLCKYDPSWVRAKYLLVADLRDILNLKLVRFVEEYRKKEEKEEKHDHAHEHADGHNHDDGHAHEHKDEKKE